MEAQPWTVTAFKDRRRDTWKSIRLWLIPLALGILGFAVPLVLDSSLIQSHQTGLGSIRWSLSSDDLTEGQFTVFLGSLVAIGAAIVGIVVGVNRHYRCPNCEKVPVGSWNLLGPGSFGRKSGVDLGPSVCPNCGARLG